METPLTVLLAVLVIYALACICEWKFGSKDCLPPVKRRGH